MLTLSLSLSLLNKPSRFDEAGHLMAMYAIIKGIDDSERGWGYVHWFLVGMGF